MTYRSTTILREYARGTLGNRLMAQIAEPNGLMRYLEALGAPWLRSRIIEALPRDWVRAHGVTDAVFAAIVGEYYSFPVAKEAVRRADARESTNP